METKTRQLRRRLERDGWYLARRGSGHDIYRHPAISGIIAASPQRRLARRRPVHRTKGGMVGLYR